MNSDKSRGGRWERGSDRGFYWAPAARAGGRRRCGRRFKELSDLCAANWTLCLVMNFSIIYHYNYEFIGADPNSQYRTTATATAKHSSPSSSTKTSSQVCRPIPLQKAESASFPMLYWSMVVVLIHPRTVCSKKSLSI